jgi:hypothetical protein
MLTIRRLLTCLGLVCLVGFFFPSWYWSKTLQGVSESKFTLGIPSSPWLVFYRKDTEVITEKNEDGTIRSVQSGGFSQGQKIVLISWSMLLGIAGFGLIEASWRLRPKITSEPET